jgi:hypothetical protein
MGTPYRSDRALSLCSGFAAEPLAAFVSSQSGISFNVVRPFDYGQFAAKVILGLGVLATIKLVYKYFAFLLFHKNTWAAVTIVSRDFPPPPSIILVHLYSLSLANGSCHDFWTHVQSDP